MPFPDSFTQFVRSQNSTISSKIQNSAMDLWSVNRKRPSATYDDFAIAKRHQQAQVKASNDSLFISDDEDDYCGEDDPFAEDSSSDLGFMGRPGLEASDQPVHRRPQTSSQQPTVSNNFPPNNNLRLSEVVPKAGIGAAGQSQNSAAPSSSAPSTLHEVDNTQARIKEEKDEVEEPAWVKEIDENELVKIYVGKNNSLMWTKRTNLQRSPKLESYIITDTSGDEGSYIMRPQLAKTEPGLFDALLQFIDADEYGPLLLEKGGGTGATMKIWDNLTTAEHYAKELVRSGRLYLLAKEFEVEGMADKVYQKITAVDPQKFTLRSVIELAGVVFDDKRLQIQGGEDKLEKWVVDRTAANFQEIMTSHQTAFWKVERQTKQANFFAKVLETIAHRYRSSGGKLQEAVVELD